VDDGGRCDLPPVAGLDTLGLQALMVPAWLLRLTPGASSATGASALELRLGHAHHLFGNVIRFPLVFVSRLVDRQFRLYCSRRRRMHGNAAKIMLKAR